MQSIKKLHIGRNIERIRELKGIKQDVLAKTLGVSQQTISRIEQSETIDDERLTQVAKALNISPEAIKNFDENTAINIFSNNFSDNASINHNCTQTFNPIEKWIETVEENKKLYERLLKEKDTVIEILKKQPLPPRS